MKLYPNILFLTLKVFSATGGIEKVCRVAGKALYEFGIENEMSVQLFSMHDSGNAADHNKYFPSEIFTGYNVGKSAFMQAAVRKGCNSQVVILSHVNLLLAGWLIRKLSPSVKIILLAHGIEIWDRLSPLKLKMLDCCDEIVSVSEFTRKKVIEIQEVDPAKCHVINNCLDPFLPDRRNVAGKESLRERYGFDPSDKIFFTLTRLSARERYKGYDKVMQAVKQMNNKNVKYLIAGSYDIEEKRYIDNMIMELGLTGQVVLAGFIVEEEVPAHFSFSDCYVMPSVKEGFGIVFIEAMFYGIPVIAANEDGSVDALLNGKLGTLVDPADVSAIRKTMEAIIRDPQKYIPDHAMLMDNFSYDTYKVKLAAMLKRNLN